MPMRMLASSLAVSTLCSSKMNFMASSFLPHTMRHHAKRSFTNGDSSSRNEALYNSGSAASCSLHCMSDCAAFIMYF